MKKNHLLVVLLFISFKAFTQGEANIWYFGDHAGLDFKSGNPVALNDGKMQTYEGCATISNAAGQLILYTDGISVYNRNHEIMPNGTELLGNPSSSQSAVVVPKPNSPNIYYIFTSTDLAKEDGVCYSIVDLNLNGGLGDVTLKNISLLTPACEKITVVKNANNEDYWVVIHGYAQEVGSNSFLAYKINSNGIDLNPVISNTGDLIGTNGQNDTVGYLKFSPDGTKLLCANYGKNISLFDFDSATGIISNPKLVITKLANYGIEFSPSGNYAYATTGDVDIFELIQFDLTASNIPSTATLIYQADIIDHQVLGLQLANNGKIYVAIDARPYLAVIDNPEVLGTGCNFILDAVSLGNGICRSGLPQYIQSYFNIGITIQNSCIGAMSKMELTGNQNITAAVWDFGDGQSATAINPNHQYSLPGTYVVSVTATSASGTITKKRNVVIADFPIALQPTNMIVCDDDNDGFYNFDLTKQNSSIVNGVNPNLFVIKYYANAKDYNDKLPILDPKNYKNEVAYKKQNIIAEVSNSINASCKSTTAFDIELLEQPFPNPPANISNLSICDNTAVGTNLDGKVIFDLTQKSPAVLNGQSPSVFSVDYFKDVNLTQNIASPTTYKNTNTTETIYIKMTNKQNPNCFATSSFKIEVLVLPVLPVFVTLKQCDDDNDGFSVFNLNEAVEKISTNAANETITFFETNLDAQFNNNPITNAAAYTNRVVSNDKVFARVTNGVGCFSITTLNLIVATTKIPLTFTQSFTVCDDAVSGTNTDGISAFDFSTVTNQIQNIFPKGQLLDITYYKNINDALAEKNAITNISNYRNVGSPKKQDIYIRVDSQLNNDCLGLGKHITLNVEPIPVVEPIVIKRCDDNHDGLFSFDTSNIQTSLLNGLNDVTVSYFDQNKNALPSPLPNPFVTTSKIVNVIVTNNTTLACDYKTTIQFMVEDLPEAFPIPTNLSTACDDEINPITQNGLYGFDTSLFESIILGNQTNRIVKYYDKNNNALPSPLPNPFVTATQNIKVQVINPANTTCNSTSTIPFIVNAVPNIILTGNELVCSDNINFTKVIDGGLLTDNTQGSYNYTWFKDGLELPSATDYKLTVNSEGIYSVEVRNKNGCERTRTITVTASDIATIKGINVTDLSDNNNVVIMISGNGNYIYSLDNEVFQESNTFNNVNSGIYTVIVKDLNGCGIATREISVLGIPKYFTPNGDGKNDFWNIKGANLILNSHIKIYIFDRYGKLINDINPTSQGWDGTYNGKQLPSTDYWYSIELENGKVIKGHFTLKR